MKARAEWPSDAADFDRWGTEVELAGAALPSDDADKLVLRSLQLQLATAECNHDRIESVALAIRRLARPAGAPAHDAALATLLGEAERLGKLPLSDCADATRRLAVE